MEMMAICASAAYVCGVVNVHQGLEEEYPDPRDISQINFFLSLVNAKRELFSPLVIVGSQIFERPSGGRYGGRWISDRYLKSNIWSAKKRQA